MFDNAAWHSAFPNTLPPEIADAMPNRGDRCAPIVYFTERSAPQGDGNEFHQSMLKLHVPTPGNRYVIHPSIYVRTPCVCVRLQHLVYYIVYLYKVLYIYIYTYTYYVIYHVILVGAGSWNAYTAAAAGAGGGVTTRRPKRAGEEYRAKVDLNMALF